MIIQIAKNEWQFRKKFVHEALKGLSGVFESKRHEDILKKSEWGDDGISLTGYTLTPAGAELRVTLFWKARAAPRADYSTFVHVVNGAGSIVAQADAQPVAGTYPTSIWSAGEIVVDTIPVPVSSGDYQVYVGLYRWDTQAS